MNPSYPSIWFFLLDSYKHSWTGTYRVIFLTGTPPKKSKYNKVNLDRLGVSRPIYVNVDSPNLGFPYFFRGVPVKKNILYFENMEKRFFVIWKLKKNVNVSYPSSSIPTLATDWLTDSNGFRAFQTRPTWPTYLNYLPDLPTWPTPLLIKSPNPRTR